MKPILLILISAFLFAKLMCDWIKFKPHIFKSDWMLARGKYSWDKRSVWTKGIFSFVSDGWHFFDAVRNMSFIISITMIINLLTGLPLYYCILGYALFGGAFNLLYKIK